jgi:hypothetical protein
MAPDMPAGTVPVCEDVTVSVQFWSDPLELHELYV